MDSALQKGVELEIVPIGMEAFVFFVNKKNPVDELTTDQIRAIYRGEITNWRDVGGSDKIINPLTRIKGSGSQTMMDKFMEDLDAQCAEWKGSHNTPLSISKGFSQTRDIVALEQETRRDRIEKMAKIADRRMYEDKKAYYERTGKDRRR